MASPGSPGCIPHLGAFVCFSPTAGDAFSLFGWFSPKCEFSRSRHQESVSRSWGKPPGAGTVALLASSQGQMCGGRWGPARPQGGGASCLA